MMNKKLYYIHDPMCSWCFGFHPAWQKLLALLPDDIEVIYLLGGLAADTTEVMPEKMQAFIRYNWEKIATKIPGTVFNFDFFTRCTPRRATYPACRAVIAAEVQQTGAGIRMTEAIQNAYYTQAKNPSDNDVLIALAQQLGLDTLVFSEALNAEITQKTLIKQVQYGRHELGVSSFPSLVISNKKQLTRIPIDYINADSMLRHILYAIA